MIYTSMTIKAMKLAYKAHEGQVDRSGVPYIFHPIHLAELMDEVRLGRLEFDEIGKRHEEKNRGN